MSSGRKLWRTKARLTVLMRRSLTTVQNLAGRSPVRSRGRPTALLPLDRTTLLTSTDTEGAKAALFIRRLAAAYKARLQTVSVSANQLDSFDNRREPVVHFARFLAKFCELLLMQQFLTTRFQGPFTVTITAQRATELPKKDLLGKIDAYVQLQNADGKFQTEVVMKNYNPTWGHRFPSMTLGPRDKFKLSVWDWDKRTSHDKVWKGKFTVGGLIRELGKPVLDNYSLVFRNAAIPVSKRGHLYLDAIVTLPYALPPHELTDFLLFAKLADSLVEMKTHEVFYEDLLSLRSFDIVMICDDSGSMVTPTSEGSRWSELKETVRSVVAVATALDDDGIDVLFLNRPGLGHVRTVGQIEIAFKPSPSGGTDLAGALRVAYTRKQADKPLLIVLATDGRYVRSNHKSCYQIHLVSVFGGLVGLGGTKVQLTFVLKATGVPNSLPAFVSQLDAMPPDVYLSVLACSDQDGEIGYLNELDAKYNRMDVLDDYKSERAEVWKVMGQVDYTKGDHVARMLLGPVFPKYDNLDEFKGGITEADWK